jgi:hypothetical protein
MKLLRVGPPVIAVFVLLGLGIWFSWNSFFGEVIEVDKRYGAPTDNGPSTAAEEASAVTIGRSIKAQTVVTTRWGAYPDRLVVELPGTEGRNVIVAASFRYVDPEGMTWSVPAGAIVDGASIPQWAWSFMGGPFEGLYRAASVIHDFFCDTKRRPWKKTHIVFYEAMRRSGVSDFNSKVMWAAVRYFGPRWRTMNRFGRCVDECDQPLPSPAVYNRRWFSAYVDWVEKDTWKLDIYRLELLAEYCDFAYTRPDPSSKVDDDLIKATGSEVAARDFLQVGCPGWSQAK